MRWIKVSLYYQEETNEAKNNACHSFDGLEYLRLLITDLNTFWISVIYWWRIMTELQGLRARSKFLRGSRREGIIRFYAPFHCFRSSHYCLSTKAEKQIVIVNNDLLFHFSQLLFHSLKTIKAVQNNVKTQKQYKNHMFNLSLLGCIWRK